MKKIIFLGIILLLPALMFGCTPSGPSNPIITSFVASPTTIDGRDNSTLTWEVSGATSVLITLEVAVWD